MSDHEIKPPAKKKLIPDTNIL